MKPIHAATHTRATAALAIAALLGVVAGCAAPAASNVPASTGSAGGSAAVGAAENLQTCAASVGTVRLQDANASSDTNERGTGDSAIESLRLLLRDVNDMQQKNNDKGGVTIDSLRLLIQQSNCLAIVERGIGEGAANDEKRRARSSSRELRNDADMGPGQEVAADFVLRSTILAVNANESSSGFRLGAIVPFKFAQGLGSSSSVSSADVQLVLFDVRSKMQLAVAQGHGTGSNTNLATSVLGRVGGGLGAGQFQTGSNTSAARIMLQAYADAYNKLVPALNNYKTQSVKGGLGTGGTLRVQGSKADEAASAKK